MARVQAIHLSAVKSLRLQSVTEARIDRDGIAGDREFLLLDDRNRATTQRELGVLAQVSSRYDGTVLELQMPEGEVISGEPRHGESPTPTCGAARSQARWWRARGPRHCQSSPKSGCD